MTVRHFVRADQSLRYSLHVDGIRPICVSLKKKQTHDSLVEITDRGGEGLLALKLIKSGKRSRTVPMTSCIIQNP